MRRSIIIGLSLCLSLRGTAQTEQYAEQIRVKYNIPELNYAVITSGKTLEMHALGYKKVHSRRKAELSDQFRLGSNTKAITGFIATLLVRDAKIDWKTHFFDLFPELKSQSNPAYYDMTLESLLTMRVPLPRYTYTDQLPAKGQFSGGPEEQMHQFMAWMLRQKPMPVKGLCFSNPSYVAAGMMLEKASGKTYRQLVEELGKQLMADFHFGQPNVEDSLQPWGHNAYLQPEAPAQNYKLSWLLPAGNVTASLPDYACFVREQLKGLKGKSQFLKSGDYRFLLEGRDTFSVGWFYDIDEFGNTYSWNQGNPGTFLSYTYVYPDADAAFILLCNAQTDAAEKGMDLLLKKLSATYIKPGSAQKRSGK